MFRQRRPCRECDRIPAHTMAVRLSARLYTMTAAWRQVRHRDQTEAASIALPIISQAKAEVQQAIALFRNRQEVADRPLPPAFPRQQVHSLAVLNACAKCSFVPVWSYKPCRMHRV